MVRDNLGNELQEGDPVVLQIGTEMCLGSVAKLSAIVTDDTQPGGHVAVTVVKTFAIQPGGVVYGLIAPKTPTKLAA